MTKTIVIFRRWPNGDIIALFPEEPFSTDAAVCLSYEHLGQHAAADPGIVDVTTLASPEQYANLKRELERQGHFDLDVRTRVPHYAYTKRYAKIAALLATVTKEV